MKPVRTQADIDALQNEVLRRRRAVDGDQTNEQPEMREWLVPIYRTVTYANQPGTIRVQASSQANALEIARSFIQEDGASADSVEWEPVSEIYGADSPQVLGDLDESDVLPVDDTAPALAKPGA